tara:strand:+ start:134 stop:361 length:228 start_codon:yes stop_codon:yes gene_type:complete
MFKRNEVCSSGVMRFATNVKVRIINTDIITHASAVSLIGLTDTFRPPLANANVIPATPNTTVKRIGIVYRGNREY